MQVQEHSQQPQLPEQKENQTKPSRVRSKLLRTFANATMSFLAKQYESSGLVEKTLDVLAPVTNAAYKRLELEQEQNQNSGQQLRPADQVGEILLKSLGSDATTNAATVAMTGIGVAAIAFNAPYPETLLPFLLIGPGLKIAVTKNAEEIANDFFPKKEEQPKL